MNRISKKRRSEWGRGFRIVYSLTIFCVFMMCAGLSLCYGKEPPQPNSQKESAVYINPDTGYEVWVEDEAELLTQNQCMELVEVMKEITAYGNSAFVTIRKNELSTENFARNYYMNRFATDSGTVFIIDMDHRNIWIHSDGEIYKVITTAYANTITDNVYSYASGKDYYGCAKEAFAEIEALLKGQRIAEPMKYISNALLALILALLANFGLVICFTRLPKPKDKAVLSNIHRKFSYSNLRAAYSHQTRIYDPISGGSGGSSGSGRGGGGSSGGGRSGGGGGHRF